VNNDRVVRRGTSRPVRGSFSYSRNRFKPERMWFIVEDTEPRKHSKHAKHAKNIHEIRMISGLVDPVPREFDVTRSCNNRDAFPYCCIANCVMGL
jgi:hypothetical protein